MQYLFILGTSPLCSAELSAVLKRFEINSHIENIQPSAAMVESSVELPVDELMEQLGGTIKISLVVGHLQTISALELTPIIISSMDASVFGLSNYSSELISIPKLVSDIKTELQATHKSVRYVLPREGSILSSVVIKKQEVTEFMLFKFASQWLVAKTLAVQNSDAWSARDFGRPYADAHAGMLPIKVARMMVNLSLTSSKNLESLTLLDPFCGMGTVLSETLVLGCSVIGSDIDAVRVDKAAKNIAWLRQNYPNITAPSKLLVADAVHISDYFPPASIDRIVTEPFLGRPFETKNGHLIQEGKRVTPDTIANTIKGLEKLYIGALRNWQKILKPSGVVIIVLPVIVVDNREYFVKKVIDNCEKLGYTLAQGPYNYSRPQAIVCRQMYVFRKN